MAVPLVRDVSFNACFWEAWNCKKRYRILYGSAGSGKSVHVAQEYIIKLADPANKGANLLVLRGVDEMNRYSTYSELCKAIYKIWGANADRTWDIIRSPLMIRHKQSGNEIIFRGMADDRQREKIKSVAFPNGQLTWIWLEEATEFRMEDVEILDDRLRGEMSNPNLYYQITMTFNPVSASHWIKGRYFDFKSPDVYTHKSTYLDNAYIDDAYHRRMMERKRVDPEGYEVYGKGNWGELGGLILTNYQVHDFDINDYFFDAMIMGADWGFNHYTVLLLLGFKDGEIYVCKELAVRETEEKDIIAMAKQMEFPKHIRIWADSSRPDTIRAWKTAGFRIQGVDKGGSKGSVKDQITWLKDRKIHIHPSCVHTFKEIQGWKWIKDKKTGQYIDEPTPFDDDAMAALRYGVEDWRKKRRFNLKVYEMGA